jgi:hypothetical protein
MGNCGRSINELLLLDRPGSNGTAILDAGQVAAREKLLRRKGRAKKEEEEGRKKGNAGWKGGKGGWGGVGRGGGEGGGGDTVCKQR